jgi:hypothetical protein
VNDEKGASIPRFMGTKNVVANLGNPYKHDVIFDIRIGGL